jgi:hypothetical protein
LTQPTHLGANGEQAWLALSGTLHRRGILAVTFMDMLRSPIDAGRLMARLNAAAGHLFRKIVPARRIQAAAIADAPAAA